MSEVARNTQNPEPSDVELEKRAYYEDMEGKRVKLNPEIPFNHKWFQGEFHTAPWGADTSPFGGATKDRVRLSMLGKKMSVTKRNGIGSVYGIITAVVNPEDKQHISRGGWFRVESLSRKSGKRRTKI